MNVENIPFNMNYFIDQTLHEVAESEEKMRQGINYLKDKIEKTEDELELAVLKSMVGVFYRIVTNFQESILYLVDAFDIFKGLGEKKQMLETKMRLGVSYQYNKQFSKSEAIFCGLLDKLEGKGEKFLPFIGKLYFYMGRNKFDQQHNEKALEYFLLSLDIQVETGDLVGLSNSEKAIGLLREL